MAETKTETPDKKTFQVILDKEEIAGLDFLRKGLGLRKFGPAIRAAVKYCIRQHRLGKLDFLNQRIKRKKPANASEPLGD
ncbi:MAG TPA: hypothetical protein PKE69_21000 [Pyrinomonadaceae bacterium]|nr:hypothetical protein [Pyrinomonadaceae bacterium]